MKIISKTLKMLPLFLLVIGLTSCSDDDNDGPGVQTTTVIDVALANNLTSLATALEVTGLVDDLEGTGPFTVFAPDNNAFATLLADTGLDLNNLSSAEEDIVRNILLNHVIAGENLSASDLVNANAGYRTTLATGPGNTNLSIYFNASNGVVLNGISTVTDADNEATNGVLHIVNEVITLPTVVTFAVADPTFDLLEATLGEADGDDSNPMFIPTLLGDGPFTVLAPTNAAFTALLASNDNWNSPADIDDDLLNSVLSHHVIVGANATSNTLSDGMMVGTLEGDMLTVNLPGNDGNPAKLTDGSGNTDIDVVVVDVQASNGVVHAVESVLIPNTDN